MENKQSLDMASAEGLYINRAEVCMVLDWPVFYVFLCNFILNSSCQYKPLPSRRGQWWRWRMLLTSSLGTLAGPGLLFFRPWRNYAPQLHHWGRNLCPDPSSSFQDPKVPIVLNLQISIWFLIGVPVFSVNTCLVECSGIICNLGI
jgi:hypothetical protein